MKGIKVTIPGAGDVRLYPFADEHIGNPFSDLARIRERVSLCAQDPRGYAVMNGDLIENITRGSIGNIYEQRVPPTEQIKKAIELFEPIAKKILCFTTGNHEERTMRSDGIDISRILSIQWGIEDRYAPEGAYLFITLGKSKHDHSRGVQYTVYVTHGKGGSGSSVGSKLNNLYQLASIVDADVYLHGHTHMPGAFKAQFFRPDARNTNVRAVDKLFVCCASNVEYGGYAQRQCMKPLSNRMPIITLSDGTKNASVEL